MATKRPRKTPAKKTKATTPLPVPSTVVVGPFDELLKQVQELAGRCDTLERANKELRRTVRALDGRVQQLGVLVERALKAHEVFVAALAKEASERKKGNADLVSEHESLRRDLQYLTRSMTEGVLHGGN